MVRGSLAGNTAASFAAILFGASVAATRVAVQDIPPLSLAVLRFGLGGGALSLSIFILARTVLRVERRDVPFLILLGVIFFSIFPLTFNASLRLTEASRGALMLATMPLWSAWLDRVARKEHLSFRQIAGITLALTGVAIVLAERGLTWRGTPWALLGDGLMLLTALCGAAYGVLAQRVLVRYSALTVTTYAMVFGTVLLFPAAFAEGLPRVFAGVDSRLAALIIFLGIFGGALGYYLWTFALSHLTPTQVAVYGNLNPMVATILGAALLAEKLTGVFGVGFVAVLSGVLLVNWPRTIQREI